MAAIFNALFASCLLVAWVGALAWRPRFVMEPFGVGVEACLVPLAFALGVLGLLRAGTSGRAQLALGEGAVVLGVGAYVLFAPLMPDAMRHAGFGFSLWASAGAWLALRDWLGDQPRRVGWVVLLFLAGIGLQGIFTYLQHTGHSWEKLLTQTSWQPLGDALLKVLEALPDHALPSGTLGSPSFLAFALAVVLPALLVGAFELQGAWMRGMSGVAAIVVALLLLLWAPPLMLLVVAGVSFFLGIAGLLMWRGVPGVGAPGGTLFFVGAFGLFRAFLLERSATLEALGPFAAVRQAALEPLWAVGPFGVGLGGWRESGYAFLQRVYPSGVPESAALWLLPPLPGVQLWLELGVVGVGLGIVLVALLKWQLHTRVERAPERVFAAFFVLGLAGFAASVLPWWSQPALWAWVVLSAAVVWPLPLRGDGETAPAISRRGALVLALLLAGVAVADVARWVLPAYQASEAHFIGYRMDVVRPGSVRGAPAYEVAARLERQPSASLLAGMRAAQKAEQWAEVVRLYERGRWRGFDAPEAAGGVVVALEKLGRSSEALPLLEQWINFLPPSDGRRAELKALRDRLALKS